MANQRNGFNSFSVPYMNELTANQYNVASIFNGNMPVGFVNHSLETISNFFQNPQKPKPATGPEILQMPNRGIQFPEPGTPPIYDGDTGQTIPGTPPIIPPNTASKAGCNIIDLILGRPCTGPLVGNAPMKSDGKGTLGDDPTHSGAAVDSVIKSVGGLGELSTRTIIVVIGIVILVAAIVSLR